MVWKMVGFDDGATGLSSYAEAALDARYLNPALVVGQNDSTLPATWDLCLSPASSLDTAAMGTLKTLGAPANAFEIEWDGVAPVASDDGTITCTTGAPTQSGSLATTWGSGTPTTSGTAWTNPTNAVGTQNAANAVFTTATAYAVGYIDVPFTLPALPGGTAVVSVTIHVQAFASSDGRMPYTAQPMDGATLLSTAQYANNTTTLTYTGITAANLAAFKIRVQGIHNEDTTSATLNLDAVSVVVNYSPTPHYRSELVFTSDKTDAANVYTTMRYVEGQRVRVAFDVLTYGFSQQDTAASNIVFQGIGASTNGSWPAPNITLYIENGTWRVGGGTAIGYTELGNLLVRPAHDDGRWTRWEFDILLGRGGTGTLKAWMDGVLVGTWAPTSGTYYGGTGNPSIDLAFMYFKNGLYGQASIMPALAKTLFRNRRFSVTSVDGATTTTWRGPQMSSPGLHIFRRNATTGMPY